MRSNQKFSKLTTDKAISQKIDPRLTIFTPLKTPIGSNNFDELIVNEASRLPFNLNGKESEYSFYDKSNNQNEIKLKQKHSSIRVSPNNSKKSF